MKICAACQKEIPIDLRIGRRDLCPFCGADLHCCFNCVFFERGAYNDCRESQAERVLEKNRANFCDFFRFKETTSAAAGRSGTSPKDKLEALFRK
jgi:hypothetical protein